MGGGGQQISQGFEGVVNTLKKYIKKIYKKK